MQRSGQDACSGLSAIETSVPSKSRNSAMPDSAEPAASRSGRCPASLRERRLLIMSCRFRSQPNERCDKVAGPPVYVVFTDRCAHAFHAFLPLSTLHDDCRVNRFSGFFNVIGVHQKRIPQFAAGAGKLAQDQDPSLSVREATYSLATRFMPSCREVTMQISAAP